MSQGALCDLHEVHGALLAEAAQVHVHEAHLTLHTISWLSTGRPQKGCAMLEEQQTTLQLSCNDLEAAIRKLMELCA